ncbi:putative reverse transcriptase zinc-binding domain-containing protein [Medicago truncatula]|uniref:Putative reverse transcriptase zinc-binding domain-containing protein n=1 Tax=Medicago truncatula TaxID=3880 RepID=A0A396GN02_MEDTR|nr:putative reverse transcriptase zinc-binding domain-containing protein [Medicago truncatula]
MLLCHDVYHLFTTSDHNTKRVTTTTIWLKHVPLKVTLFAWRLFRNRLPTKDNLLMRGIIKMKQPFALADAEFRSQQIIFSSLAVILVSYGCKFGVGLVSLRLILIVLRIIFTSLVTYEGFLDKLISF